MMQDTFPNFTTEKYRDKDERATAASLPVSERQRRMETMLVEYPLFKRTISAVKSFHLPVDGGTRGKGQICGLLGQSRAGKTWAIKNYAARVGNIQTENATVPSVVYLDVQEGWTSHDCAVALYKAIGFKSVPRVTTQSIFGNFIDEVCEHGVELVIIDDAQFLLRSQFRKTVKDAFGLIVGLAERNTCNVILSGTDDVAIAMLQNPHAMNRGSFPRIHIEPYNWQVETERRNFQFLLNAIDERLPFAEASGLANPKLAPHFYRVSNGLVGIVMNYVRAAAFIAMNEGAHCIKQEHLRQAGACRRAPNDPYEPFASAVDVEDPNGERRKNEELALKGARTMTLDRKRKTGSII